MEIGIDDKLEAEERVLEPEAWPGWFRGTSWVGMEGFDDVEGLGADALRGVLPERDWAARLAAAAF